MSDPQTFLDVSPATTLETPDQASVPKTQEKHKRANMHEGIAIWCDCCSCEPEGQWIEVAEEMGISLSDYEPEDSNTP